MYTFLGWGAKPCLRVIHMPQARLTRFGFAAAAISAMSVVGALAEEAQPIAQPTTQAVASYPVGCAAADPPYGKEAESGK